jgi:tetratricopeptide (TPR) repeat protein
VGESKMDDYESKISLLPKDAQDIYNSGSRKISKGNYIDGINLLRDFVKKYPQQPAGLANLAIGLHRIGELKEALSCCDFAITYAPFYTRLYSIKGNILQKLKQFEEAITNYNRSIMLNPNNAIAYNNRGNAFQALQKTEEAIANFDRAIALNPKFSVAYINCGNTLRAVGRLDEAVISYSHAIDIDQNNADTHLKRAIVLKECLRLEDALIDYDKAISIRPEFIEAIVLKAITLRVLGKFDDSIKYFNYATTLKPKGIDEYCFYGIALKEQDRILEALFYYKKALCLDQNSAWACNCSGVLYHELMKLDKAIHFFDKSISLSGGYNDAYWNKSLILLTLGDLKNGFKLYERRIKMNHKFKKYSKTFLQPYWDGSASLADKKLLVVSEQGVGDIIQFSRYIPEIGKIAKKVIFATRESLLQLFSVFCCDNISVINEKKLPKFDIYCSVVSLPHVFGTTLNSIPAKVPYLFADPQKIKKIRSVLGKKNKIRIGIACSGSQFHLSDKYRSIPLVNFSNLFKLPYEFHLLQKEIRPDDINYIQEGGRLFTHVDELDDFSDTAALISEMDLIISVDTSIAHIAGALAKPVWILLQWASDWRWLLNREDSPWYPSAKLFRQKKRGDWDGVINELVKNLDSESVVSEEYGFRQN